MGEAQSNYQLQRIILDLLKAVQRFFDEHQIEYYMLGGTLLGAIRHKGFIPWDDDVDLGVPREQYEYVLQHIDEALPDYMRLETYRNCKEHHYYFSRIVDTRYVVKRTGSEKERDEYVWLEIYPLDGMPSHKLAQIMYMIRFLYIRARFHISTFDKVNLKRKRPFVEQMIIKFVHATKIGARRNDMYKWLDKIDKMLKKYPYAASAYIVNGMGGYKFKEMFKKEVFDGGVLYDFEDMRLKGPKDYDAYLKQLYGDYMTPPKEAGRNVHAAYFDEKQVKGNE